MAIPLSQCRICNSAELEPVLSLGQLPPVNSFLAGSSAIAREKKHPLGIAFCRGCSHVQLTHRLDPRDIFEEYIYFSSMSESIVRWGEHLAERYRRELALTASSLVAELASNDGCILKPFTSYARVLGVEPAKNIAKVANENGVPTVAEFFNGALSQRLASEHGSASLIIARNVVAHVPDVVDFIAGAYRWLAPGGVLHVEVPYLRPMLDSLEFDTIYHEHLSYFSVSALDRLFREAGTALWDVEEIPLHGGSLIARAKKGAVPLPSVNAYLSKEREAGLTTIEPLRSFARRTEEFKNLLPEFLGNLKRDGHRLAAYGAAAKGVVLTNYCGINGDLVDWVADRSPYKQGKRMPGVHLPVVSPEAVFDQRPAYLLILAWNFVEEIVRQLSAYSARGGKFVLPIPQPRILEGSR